MSNTSNITAEDFGAFVSYCASFYGVGGLYAEDFTRVPSLEDIARAARIVVEADAEGFEGDSVDRERVADILYAEDAEAEETPAGVFTPGTHVTAVDGYDGYNFGRVYVVVSRTAQTVTLQAVRAFGEHDGGTSGSYRSNDFIDGAPAEVYDIAGEPGAEVVEETADGFTVWA